MKYLFSFLILVGGLNIPLLAQEDIDLFEFWKYYSDAENSMYKASCELAFEQLDDRRREISGLTGKEGFLQRQSKVRKTLDALIGPLPEKTPLNAKVTGVIKKDDYRVEMILFESVPGYYVTAALFLPRPRKGKVPVVIYASGHTDNGFRSETYQHVLINLVKKGFAVFAFDPIGQGERWQYFDQQGNRQLKGTTIEHSYPGVQCYIAGHSPTNYFVWDGIRSVDYLLTRKEIDPERIGMTGRSGGGTQTAFTAAYDERILAAAPECFITNMEYILKSIGPQDAEQNLHRMIEQGLDHADLLEVRAPKPALMVTTTRDFFSIQGARETFTEVKQFYTGLGASDNIHMVEDDEGHKSTRKNREAMYAFFQQYLDNPGSAEDLEVETFPEEDLWVTESGRVADLGGESLFSLNQKVVNQQVEALKQNREQSSGKLDLEAVRRISGFSYPQQPAKVVFSGRFQYEGYQLEKYLLQGGGDYQLPLALFKPESAGNGQLVLYFDQQGMKKAAGQQRLINELMNQGLSVLVADLPGIGSLGPGYLKGDAYVDNTSFNQWFAGNLNGKSIVAMRAEDMVRITGFAKSQLEGVTSIAVLALGTLGSEALHAANFETDISQVALINPFLSYAEIAMTRHYMSSYIPSVVAGAVKIYDLPDLMAGLDQRRLFVVNPLNAQGEAYNDQELNNVLNYPGQVLSNTGKDFQLSTDLNESQIVDSLLEWFK